MPSEQEEPDVSRCLPGEGVVTIGCHDCGRVLRIPVRDMDAEQQTAWADFLIQHVGNCTGGHCPERFYVRLVVKKS
ncbi:MAG TPA: hypothetical protein VM537_31475 [Anaerolineae bacterium]|nr:hypothetical protein [Anaerolineae bacterium]